MPSQRIPVTVIGGYLGAGKTTLVNHLLRNSGERIAVLVNDFGEVSIDEDLIVAADGDKLTLANGCICCSLAGGFAEALVQVRSADPLPDRLVIEASGVAEPAQIAAYGYTPGLRLDAVVTVADAEQVRRQAEDRWVADIVRTQLAAADLLIVNKADLLDGAAAADALCDWLAGIARGATIVRASRAEVPVEVVLGPPLESADASTPEAVSRPMDSPKTVPAADDLFDSQTVVLDAPVPLLTLEALLAELPEGVARLKGLVQTVPHGPSTPTSGADGTGNTSAAGATAYLIEAVGGRTSMTPHEAEPPPSRWAVSVIAAKGSILPGWLREALHQHH